MTFSLQYENDHQRLIMAVVNDARNTIPETTNQPGAVIYAYSQSLISQIVAGVILYRVVTDQGNLSGVVAINTVVGSVGVVFLILRPAAGPFLSEISQIISTFISENQFLNDVIY